MRTRAGWARKVTGKMGKDRLRARTGYGQDGQGQVKGKNRLWAGWARDKDRLGRK